jgi:hypothetical protein
MILRMGILLAALTSIFSFASGFTATVEGGAVWQSRNDVEIPNGVGTRFSLVDAGSGPFPAYRIYAGYDFNDRHGVRLLFAPLSVSATGTYAQNISFAGSTYSAGTPLTATYQFNSYRLTYRYKFYQSEQWDCYVGFTGKIRDAKIALSQGATASESKNVGFVPLLHFAANYRFADQWRLIFDLDGLMAPQGRAFDVTLQAGWQPIPELEFSAGYRTVEGGASNTTIYNFTWIHYLVFATTARF